MRKQHRLEASRLAVCFLYAAVGSGSAQQAEKPEGITVTGVGEVRVKPACFR